MSEPYYITTPIYYPNGEAAPRARLHDIVTDAIARYQRLRGLDARFLTGTDEHGQKMAETAADKGLTPRSSRSTPPRSSGLGDARHLRRPLHPHHRRRPPRRPRASGSVIRQRRHLPRRLRGLVLGARRALLHRGRARASAATGSGRHEPAAGDVDRGAELLLPAVGVRRRLLAHYEAHPEFIRPDVRRNEVVSFV